MDHRKVRARLAQYLAGELDQRQAQEIEGHLQECEACRKEAAALQEEWPEWLGPSTDAEMALNAEKILRRSRWKARLIGGITGLGMALVLFVLYMGMMMLLAPLFQKKAEEFRTGLGLSISFTQPGVQMYSTSAGAGWSGTLDFHGELSKRVGNRHWQVGEVSGKSFLWGSPSASLQWIPDREQYYHFWLPGMQPVQREDNGAEHPVWEALERLPSGTVAEMAFSLDRYYEVTEVPVLPGEHLEISWYALDTGERERFAQPAAGPVGDSGIITEPFGLSPDYWFYEIPGQEAVEEFVGESERWGWLGRATVRSSVKSREQPAFPRGYLEQVAWLAEHPHLFRSVALSADAEIPIAERYRYLRENGLHAYGIVVHGPVEELLELKGLPFLRNPQLGQVEWWLP